MTAESGVKYELSVRPVQRPHQLPAKSAIDPESPASVHGARAMRSSKSSVQFGSGTLACTDGATMLAENGSLPPSCVG
jgi:hypothetical protein